MNINNKYVAEIVINKGSFGTVAKGYKIKDNKEIIIKFDTSSINLLKHESFVLNYLSTKNVNNIPPIIYYGIYKEAPCLIMPYYSLNLKEYINQQNIDDNKSVTIIIKILHIIEDIHNNYIIHRDIKPENIMIHNDEPILIDFGLSKFFIDDNGDHIKNNKINEIIGSYKYCSYYVHEFNSPSRRDDLISVSYILIFLLFKRLPWDNIDKTKYITRKTIEYIDVLCDVKDNSHYFKSFFSYIYSLDYESEPLYAIIYSNLYNIIEKQYK